MDTTKDLEGISPEVGTLMNRLITLQEVYSESAEKFDEGVIKEQLLRLAAEKELFLHDFTNIMDFTIAAYNKKFRDRINIEKEPVKIEFDQLMLEEDESGILLRCVEFEQGVIDQYSLLERQVGRDEFAAMVVKNQSKEARRSVKELEAVTTKI